MGMEEALFLFLLISLQYSDRFPIARFGFKQLLH